MKKALYILLLGLVGLSAWADEPIKPGPNMVHPDYPPKLYRYGGIDIWLQLPPGYVLLDVKPGPGLVRLSAADGTVEYCELTDMMSPRFEGEELPDDNAYNVRVTFSTPRLHREWISAEVSLDLVYARMGAPEAVTILFKEESHAELCGHPVEFVPCYRFDDSYCKRCVDVTSEVPLCFHGAEDEVGKLEMRMDYCPPYEDTRLHYPMEFSYSMMTNDGGESFTAYLQTVEKLREERATYRAELCSPEKFRLFFLPGDESYMSANEVSVELEVPESVLTLAYAPRNHPYFIFTDVNGNKLRLKPKECRIIYANNVTAMIFLPFDLPTGWHEGHVSGVLELVALHAGENFPAQEVSATKPGELRLGDDTVLVQPTRLKDDGVQFTLFSSRLFSLPDAIMTANGKDLSYECPSEIGVKKRDGKIESVTYEALLNYAAPGEIVGYIYTYTVQTDAPSVWMSLCPVSEKREESFTIDKQLKRRQ